MAGMYQGDPMRVQGLYNPRQGGFPSLGAQNPSIKGMFDTPSYQTPGIGDGYNASMAEYQVPAGVMQQDQPVQPQQTKPGAWSKGGRAWQILGIIGDALQQAGGGKGTFMPAFLDMQEQTRKERETQQKLERQMQDFMAAGLTQQQARLVATGGANYGDFVKPQPNNDTINDFEWYRNLSPEDRALYHKMKPVYRQGPDGQFYPVDVSPVPQTAPKGVTFTPIDGGPTQPASGGFRR